MARLSAKARKKLPKTAFAYPGSRSYPIHDRPHARAALRLSARKSTKGSYSRVRSAVAKRYPDLVKAKASGRTKAATGSRRRRTSRTRRRR